MLVDNRLPPDVLAFGRAPGHDPQVAAAVAAAQSHPRRPALPADELLVATVRAALTDRSFVTFSGGVDSSLVLSAACRAARESDRPDPVPVTLRYSVAATDESDYQERMIEWLGLTDWKIIQVDDELDLIGDAAQRHLVAHGPSIAPRIATQDWWLSQLADESGSRTETNSVIFNGEGGDEVLGSAPLASLHAVRYSIRRPRFRRQAMGVAAHQARRTLHRSTMVDGAPGWLTDAGKRRYVAAVRADRGRSATMAGFLRGYRSTNGLVQSHREMSDHAHRHGLTYSSPLVDIDFLAALTDVIPEHHFINRHLVIRRHFADLLPPEIAHRTSKVYFSEAIYNSATRRFAGEWDGRTGVPLELVDPETVRAAWRAGDDARSGLMLQSAWLASEDR